MMRKGGGGGGEGAGSTVAAVVGGGRGAIYNATAVNSIMSIEFQSCLGVRSEYRFQHDSI